MPKESHEYVYVKDFPTIVADLEHSSDNLQNAINGAIEAANLHDQKCADLEAAEAIFTDLFKDINKLKLCMPIKEFKKEKHIVRAPKVEKKLPEKEFLARSQQALRNLQQNLMELKEELKKLK